MEKPGLKEQTKRKNKFMIKEYLCGCGHGKATHTFKGMEDRGFIVHILGEGNCCRQLCTEQEAPTNFRLESWKKTLTEMCTVNGQSISVYTLTNQRSYNRHPDGTWSRLKKAESINSIGDEW